MNNSKFEWKVGLFVFLGLIFSALLILNFSKGVTLFRPTYRVHIVLPTVAGLKPAADVMLAGVPIGKVAETTLSLDGRSVDVTVQILAKYKISRTAKFHIDALGFLGDQYIEVTPALGASKSDGSEALLKDGDRLEGEAPFNMQEAVRSISGLLDQGRKMMSGLDQTISNLNGSILGKETLANVSFAISNLETVASDASLMAVQLRGILDTNGSDIRVAVSNFAGFSVKMNGLADQLGVVISTNSGEVQAAVKNFRETSVVLKQLADDLEAGKGAAGSILKDENMGAELGALVTNANGTASELNLFVQHINERGLWRMLWKPKPEPTNSPSSSKAPRTR